MNEDQRISELEIQNAHLENMVESLNNIVTKLNNEMHLLNQEVYSLRRLMGQLQGPESEQEILHNGSNR